MKIIFLTIFFSVVFSTNLHADESYQLGAGDIIKIAVFEEPDMSFELTVDDNGFFAYPYLGDIKLKGKSTTMLEDELTQGLKGRVLVKPNISVSVVEYRPFSIGGEVQNPGNYPYEPRLTVKKAINLAGGVTDWSNGKRFKLERAKKQANEKFSPDSLVYPGDTITVLPRRF